MKYLKIIQVGDVHYPDNEQKPSCDLKDDSFPGPLLRVVQVEPLQVCIRGLAEECSNGVNGIVFCGDLTSKANIEKYKVITERLVDILDLNKEEKWNQNQIHVVPGNHDFPRVFSSAEVDIYEKFKLIKEIWIEVGLNVLNPDKVRVTQVEEREAKLNIISINSCIGCGEKRYLSAKIREELCNILQKYVEENDQQNSFSLVGEELDTPAFDQAHMENLSSIIGNNNIELASLIVTHHNLLPQSHLRIAPYTELLNSGQMRCQLVKASHPVVYCHGHIHDDAVEVLRGTTNDSFPLVCVAAPEMTNGFNVIKIYYNRNNVPVGCVVKRLFCNNGFIEKKDDIRIPFYNMYNLKGRVSEEALKVAKEIGLEMTRINKIKNHILRSGIIEDNDLILKDAIEESEWFGLTEITNRDQAFRHWHVRRVF